MRVTGIILIVLGVLGLLLSTMMFGDIGVAAAIGSCASLVSGIGFLKVNKAFKKMIIDEN